MRSISVGAVFVEARIQRDKFVAKTCAPGATSQTRIPFHAHETGDARGPGTAQKFAGPYFKIDIAAGGDCRSCKRKLELLKQQHTHCSYVS